MSQSSAALQTPLVDPARAGSPLPGFATLVIATMLSIILLFGGAVVWWFGHNLVVFTAGAVAVVLVFVSWSLASILRAGHRRTDQAHADALATITKQLDRVNSLLHTLSEQQLLSDRAKSVAFRDKDRDALRHAIREEMSKKDWDAALVLTTDMEREFGYTQEAAALRAEINSSRAEVVREQIERAVAVVEQHTRVHQWTQALREADRLAQLYPEDAHVKRLPAEIESRRQTHKKQLLEAWKEAIGRKDVDAGIEALKKLDPYLTPAEVESMEETARAVFKEKINLLKTQFSQAAHDERWSDAIRIRATIMQEFPNSRLAMEVRDMLEVLQQRATRSLATA